MKTKSQNQMLTKWAMLLVTASLLFGAVLHLPAQTPELARIDGTVRFNNSNMEITSFLNGSLLLGGNGRAVHAAAGAQGCAETSATTLLSGAIGDIGFRYELDVVTSPAGIPYSVGLGICGARWNLVPEVLSPPIVTPGSVTTVPVAGCIQLLRVKFVDDSGTARTVNSVLYYVRAEGQLFSYGRFDSTAGFLLALPSHVPVDVEINYETGTDITADTAYFTRTVHVAAMCDVVTEITEVIPANPPRGAIAGRLDMADFGATENREHFRNYRDYGLTFGASLLAAFRSPRDGALEPGRIDRATIVPDSPAGSSGPFLLPSLPGGAYSVYGRMQFGSGGTFNVFQTPVLYNVPVAVGTTNNLGDTLVIHPGRLTGAVELRGPAAGIRHLFLDGQENATVERETSVTAHGAPAGGFPPARGVATGKIAGSFDGLNRFLGNYSLMLGGLNGAASQWDLDALTVRFNSSSSGFPGGPYLLGAFRVNREEHDLVDLAPGRTVTKDLRLCLSEVAVHLTFGTNRVFNPRIDAYGTYEGPNRPWDAEHTKYSVTPVPESGAFEGLPIHADEAANEAVVYLYLPAGSYTLIPHVKTVSAGAEDEVQLPPLRLVSVGPCDRICASACLQPQITNAPACVGEQAARIEGFIASPCTNRVTRIEWSVPGGITNTICENCGVDPGFSFVLPVNGPCADTTFTVTAYDESSLCASITRTIPRDTTPPVIHCPTNLVVQCAGPVQFPVSVTDNCDPNPNLICTPASGSVFSVGTTTVNCVAYDRCQNESRCSFTVTVLSNCPLPCLELQCPTNIVVPCQSPNGAFVYYDFSATNLCSGGQVRVRCSPAPGSFFPIRTTEVICVATSEGETKDCRFNITVRNDCSPTNCVTLSCPKLLIWNCASVDGAYVTYGVLYIASYLMQHNLRRMEFGFDHSISCAETSSVRCFSVSK